MTLVFAASAGAQDTNCPDDPTKGELCFDHAGGVDIARSVKIGDGKTITVRIKNTCPNEFNYSITEVLAEAPAQPPSAAKGGGCKPEDKVITIVHDKRYGGYLIGIEKKDPNKIVETKNGNVLKNLQLVISVETAAWNIDTYGGFTVSGLTNPRFAIEMRDFSMTDSATGMTTTEQKPFVIRDTGAEDDVNLGIAAFAHIYHRRMKPFALTFGLGISEENDTTYYTGLSWRFGARGALTLGYAWGEVDRLPAGTKFDQPVAADLLSSLDSKIKGDFFFSYSFSFIDARDRLKKPFAGAKPQMSGAATATTTKKDNRGKDNKGKDDKAKDDKSPPDSKKTDSLALEARDCTSSEVNLSWPAVKNAATYVVRRSSQSCTALTEPITVTTTAFKDSKVVPVSQYHYDVVAKKADGTVLAQSNCVTAFTPPPNVTTKACQETDS